jgi:hypothetical protein
MIVLLHGSRNNSSKKFGKLKEKPRKRRFMFNPESTGRPEDLPDLFMLRQLNLSMVMPDLIRHPAPFRIPAPRSPLSPGQALQE